jgi:hypothetical protein
MKLTISDALHSKRLFAPFFSGPSWLRWRAVLKAVFAEPLSPDELASFIAVAERDPPKARVKQLVCVVGRGGGKDSAASLIAAYGSPANHRNGDTLLSHSADDEKTVIEASLLFNTGSTCLIKQIAASIQDAVYPNVSLSNTGSSVQ